MNRTKLIVTTTIKGEKHFLLGLGMKSPRFFDFPGGVIEKGETPLSSVKREFEEETLNIFSLPSIEKIGEMKIGERNYTIFHSSLDFVPTNVSKHFRSLHFKKFCEIYPGARERERYSQFCSGEKYHHNLEFVDLQFIPEKKVKSSTIKLWNVSREIVEKFVE